MLQEQFIRNNVAITGNLTVNGSPVRTEANPGVSTSIVHTTASLAAGAIEDFTIAAGDLFSLLAILTDGPAWIRVYESAAARDADTRTSPGGLPPLSGSGYYAEVVTDEVNNTIRFAPVPLVQGTANLAYIRLKNMDVVARIIAAEFLVLTLEVSPPPA